ncbi:MAG: hypothetical protein ACPGSN_07000 [Psychrobium sp.]
MSFKKVAIPLVVIATIIIGFIIFKHDISVPNVAQKLAERSIEQTSLGEHKQPVKVITKNTQNEKFKRFSVQKPFTAITKDPIITVCENPFEEINALERTQLEAENSRLVKVITKTPTLDSEFTNLFINNFDEAAQLENMKQLSNKYKDNPLVSYALMSLCASGKHNCSTELVTSTINKIPNNGAAWLLAAMYHATNYDHKAAESAMIEVSKSSSFDDHFSDYLTTISTAYKQAGAVDDKITDKIAVVYAVTFAPPSYSPLIELCRNTTTTNPTLLQACLTSGTLLEQSSSTVISQVIGNNIQQDIFTKLSEFKELERLKQEKVKIDVMASAYSKSLNLIQRNSSIYEEWVMKIIRNGEIKAAEFAINEAIRISNDPNINECLVVN